MMNYATPKQMLLKRTADIIGGLVGSIFTLILTIFIGPIIYIKSPGPIFFKQERVGLNGQDIQDVQVSEACTWTLRSARRNSWRRTP